MEIEILNEAGLEQALEGMLYSYKLESPLGDIPKLDMHKAMKVAKKLCTKDQGHSKFLESIQVWFRMRAPLYFWKQFDTYRVGTTKLSCSTMHTLMKRELDESDFICVSDTQIDSVNVHILSKNFDRANADLPQSFLQTRMVNTNYKVLRNMCLQREGHKLVEWDDFISAMFNQLENPELLGIDEEEA